MTKIFHTVRAHLAGRFFDEAHAEALSSLIAPDNFISFSVDSDAQRQQVLIWQTYDPEDLPELEQRLRDIAPLLGCGGALQKLHLSSDSFENKDWLEHVYAENMPFICGDFYITDGDHAQASPQDKIHLDIRAARAFGSGRHGTTAGCLEALSRLNSKGHSYDTIADIGTGSGILAIAARKLWPHAHSIASDNDPQSIILARTHFEGNSCTNVDLVGAAGFDHEIYKNKKFDLILANILAGPLIDLAPRMRVHAHEKTHLVLSGIHEIRRDEVIETYLAEGFTVKDSIVHGIWTTLILRS